MKKLLLITTLIWCTNLSLAQTIEKFSIDSGGASTTVDGITILYTLGEVNVQELSAGDISISEGFINSSSQETLGTMEVETSENNLRVFPNPTSSFINIHSNKPLGAIELYSLLGKRVLQTKNNRIAVKGLSAGVYILKIVRENKTISKKIIIE